LRENNGVATAWRQASRNLADTWRDITFGGILHIPFPVTVSAPRENEITAKGIASAERLKGLEEDLRRQYREIQKVDDPLLRQSLLQQLLPKAQYLDELKLQN